MEELKIQSASYSEVASDVKSLTIAKEKADDDTKKSLNRVINYYLYLDRFSIFKNETVLPKSLGHTNKEGQAIDNSLYLSEVKKIIQIPAWIIKLIFLTGKLGLLKQSFDQHFLHVIQTFRL